MEGEGAAAVTCSTCGMFLFLPQDVAGYTCSKCKLVTILEDKVRQLEEQVSNLRLIREGEAFLDRAERTFLKTGYAEDLPDEEISSVSQESDAWRNVTRRSRRASKETETLKLQNRFNVLGAIKDEEHQKEGTEHQQEGIQLRQQELERQQESIQQREDQHSQPQHNAQAILEESAGRRTPDMPQRRRVLVVGDSLLRGTETAVCKPDKLNREVCCLPGAKINHVTERLARLVKPTDRKPLILVHVGTNDTVRRSFRHITKDYELMGRKLKDLGVQVVISSILPVQGYGAQRERTIVEVNNWLRIFCRRQQFGFLDHGLKFHEHGLLARDGLHLTKLGRNVFANSLTRRIRRYLN